MNNKYFLMTEISIHKKYNRHVFIFNVIDKYNTIFTCILCEHIINKLRVLRKVAYFILQYY